MALSSNFAPGVRVEEAAPVAAPINTGRTLTAMMGSALRGPVNDVRLITSWSQFVATYGGFSTNVDLATHVWQFFANGGAAVRVLRVAPSDAVGADSGSDILSNDGLNTIFVAYAANPGEWGNDLSVGLVLKSIESTAGQSLNDDAGNALPNTAANAASLDTARVPVSNITKLAPGDRVDIFNSAGQIHADSVLVLAVDSSTNSVIIEKPSADIDGAGYTLKTNSQHRAKTHAVEDLADEATSILLDSTEGVNKGSLLSLYLYSHCETIASRGISAKSHVIVERVSGNRVYFTAPVENDGDNDLAAQTKAALKYESADGTQLQFEAKDAGPTGNRVTVAITYTAAANSVSVSGKTITINSSTGGAYTGNTLKTAIEANAAADALVSVTVLASGANDVDSALAPTRLTGGAKLLVTSQEFGAVISLGESEVARHDFLSLISTNKDFVEYRLGGDPAAFAPVSGSESSLLIIDGADPVVGTAAEEYARLPRSLAAVGLSGGDDGSELTDADYIGESTPATGSYLLASFSDIKLACAPGVTSPDAQIAFVERAKEEGSFVWVLDPPSDIQGASDILSHLTNDLALNTSFAMIGNTWLYVSDFRPGSLPRSEIFTPSSPVICGLIASGQKTVGDHGSCGNQVPVGVIRLAYNPSKTDRAQLNEAGVSCFAIIDGTIRLYGDRTLLTTNDIRRFGSVRRWLNAFIQKAEAGLSNVVFAPNNENLFPRVEQIIQNILSEEFQKGALYPQNDRSRAYYVRCNSETTTAEMISQGVVGLEVAVSPATQAEQIVMQLSVSAGGLTVANNI